MALNNATESNQSIGKRPRVEIKTKRPILALHVFCTMCGIAAMAYARADSTRITAGVVGWAGMFPSHARITASGLRSLLCVGDTHQWAWALTE